MRRSRVLYASALLAFAVASGPATAAPGRNSDTIPCGANGTISWTPTTVYPARGERVRVTFTYADPDGGPVALTVTPKPLDDSSDGATPIDQTGGAASDTDGGTEVLGFVKGKAAENQRKGRKYRFEYSATQGANTDGCESDPEKKSDDLVVFVPYHCDGFLCSFVD